MIYIHIYPNTDTDTPDTPDDIYIHIYPNTDTDTPDMSKFNEFKPRLQSPKNRFQS